MKKASRSRIFFWAVGTLFVISVCGVLFYKNYFNDRSSSSNTKDSPSSDASTNQVVMGNFADVGQPKLATVTLTIKGIDHRVEIAKTFEETARGLSNRSELSKKNGMLFVFESDSRWGTWMKDMRFALDVIWLSKDGVVIDIVKNIAPSTYPNIFTPSAPARYFLELESGRAEELGLKIGDTIDLSKI
jgi:uncharacterized protein